MPLTRVVLRLGRNPGAGFPEGDDLTYKITEVQPI